MKNAKVYIIAAVLMTFMISSIADAKWWIFGQSNEEVSINYLYINKVSFEEGGPKIVIYKETLPDGMIVINGKASAKKGKIGAVRVTTNNKEKWEDAKFSDNGAFEYIFRPEQGKEYVILVEVTDTAGKTNDAEATRKEVAISDQNITALIRETLDKMIEAYRNEDAGRFMSFVSEDFAGDATNLDRAIRKDFSAFDNIDLRYSLNNVASGAKGMIFVSLNFNRSVISARDGMNYTDRGVTEFVFQLGSVKVYSMKNPLIFGLSDAANVATGTVQSATNESILVLDESGNAETMPFNDAIAFINGEDTGGGSEVESGSVTLTQRGVFPVDFDTLTVSTGGTQAEAGLNPVAGDVGPKCAFPDPMIIFKSGVKWSDLGSGSIDSITEVPDQSGYSSADDTDIVEDEIYALYLTDGKYALIRVSSSTFLPGILCTTPSSIVLEYKYQPDGSRNF
ncbi:MAG: hypothetical protein HY809_08340 [Nitrospirae bacterium]|nr:hypothetical protein [Nitrospirota bacterium]